MAKFNEQKQLLESRKVWTLHQCSQLSSMLET
jgi:hypothetical protein